MTEGQPLIERKPHGAVEILRRVADQIEKMNADTFGGVAVIVPPQDGGESIEVLILDPKKNLAQFYSMIQTRLQIDTVELDARARQQQGGFPRGR
jgi:hypothetical protein